MLIKVECDDEQIFRGEADDFLFEHDNDEELEMTLSEFEESNNVKMGTYDNNGNFLTITKMRQLIY